MIKASKWSALVAGASQPPVAYLAEGLAYGDVLVMAYFLVSMVVLVAGVGFVSTVIRGITDRGNLAGRDPEKLAAEWVRGGLRGAVWFGGVILGAAITVVLHRG